MNNTLGNSAKASPSSSFGPFNSATFTVADISVMCIICDEYTPMNSADYRAQRLFICDKCKAAIKHVRNILENGGSVV
jgi:hypothetical protein